MITLCGITLSNYYNVVKMALLEKGVPFAEELVKPRSTDPAVLSISPLGKVPFIRTPQGGMCESQAILAYVESAYPEPALFPHDPYAAGKVRELMIYIDLHLELVARELYAQAFWRYRERRDQGPGEGNPATQHRGLETPREVCALRGRRHLQHR